MDASYWRTIAGTLALALGLLPVGSATLLATAQSAQTPALAQDGRGLFSETPATRASFNAVWGDRAADQWIQETDRLLSGGNAPTGPRIGLLYAGTASANPAFTQGLVSGLRTVGYHPGQDISIVWRFADGHPELLPDLAAELVQLPVDVIVAPVIAESLAVKQVTSTVPVVTMTVADPVAAGLVASLNRPGANITGVIQQPLDFNIQKLAFLKEAVPGATRIAILTTPAGAAGPALAAMRVAAPSLGLELQTLAVSSAGELPIAFDSAEQESTDALMVLADTTFTANRSRIVELAAEHRIPALYPSRLFLDEGGLMDYAFVEATRGLAAAEYVAQILKGANPAELPMRPPPEIELAINQKTAEAIGYSFPPSVLAKATDIIR
jgi:putative ABC transport system substrate-binding protein